MKPIEHVIVTIDRRISALTDLKRELLKLEKEFPSEEIAELSNEVASTPLARQGQTRANDAAGRVERGPLRQPAKSVPPPTPTPKPVPAAPFPPGHGIELPHPKTKLTPLHPELIAIGAKLPEPFDSMKLKNAAKLDWKPASNAITRWLNRGWLRRVRPGEYERTETYGKMDEGESELQAVHDLHRQISGEVAATQSENTGQ